MVDAAMAGSEALAREGIAQSSAPVLVEAWSERAAAAYRSFLDGRIAGAAQQPDWIDTWHRTQNSDIVVLWITPAGGPRMALPLEVVRQSGFRIARAVGGHHANGSFPAFDGPAPAIALEMVRTALREAQPDVDVLRIERLAPELGGVSNPLSQLPHIRSSNLSLAVDLEGGFPRVLERVGRKRRMKRHRGQIRKYEAVGDYRRLRASTDVEVDRLFGAFLSMKADRFKKMGVQNVFLGVETFWADLFKTSLRLVQPMFILDALEVGGKLRAVTGSSNIADRQICEFGAITEDELFNASPGDFLTFENIQAAAVDGFAIYDFSVGDEHYKRQWCNIETELFDIIAPLTTKGEVYALALRGTTELKRRIKANDTLWNFVKRLRRGHTAPAKTAADED